METGKVVLEVQGVPKRPIGDQIHGPGQHLESMDCPFVGHHRGRPGGPDVDASLLQAVSKGESRFREIRLGVCDTKN